MQSSTPADAVLFDLDDTLVDHRGAAQRGVRTWLRSLGIADDDAALEEAVDRWFALEARHYERCQRGEITYLEQRRVRIRAFLPGWDLADDALADDTYAGFLACYQAAWSAFEDAATAVDRAKAAGLRVGILTNGERPIQERKLRRTGLAGLGVPVFASSELPAAKPDRRSYHAACRALGVMPARVTMVGDSLRHDVLGAQAAGLTGILLDRHGWAARRRGVEGVRRIRSLDELAWA